MSGTSDSKRLARRRFLQGVAALGAGSGLGGAVRADAERGTGPDTRPVSASAPSSEVEAMERTVPEDYSAAELSRYFVDRPGSDLMVDVMRHLGIEYVASNPAASFRGLQESIVNHGGNRNPEFLTCLHEESAVAMGQGYAKAAGKPLAVMCDGVVGLQHAAMAVYNAWCDRVPVMIIAGNYTDATKRTAPVEWAHSANDPAELLRDFIKWDDNPVSLRHFAESTARAWKIATTPPMGPVVIVADAELQEQPARDVPPLPRRVSSVPPMGDSGAVTEAARMLAAAERPLLIADRAARTGQGMRALVELAEVLQAPVIDRLGRLNFPNDHYLNQTWRSVPLVREADVIMGLEVQDFWGNVNRMKDLAEREAVRHAPGQAKLISLGMSDVYMKSNYQDFQRWLDIDLAIAGDAEATLPALTEAVRRSLPAGRRSAPAARKASLERAYRDMREEARAAAMYAWDASPVSTARMCMELWRQIEGRDWSLVSDPFFEGYWPHRLWTMNRHHHYFGGSGGYGVGTMAHSSVGAALANREHGRLSVCLQPDGDLLYAPGVLWTAAHHGIPLLSVMHNNRAYHQEYMQIQRMAARRRRGVDGSARVGTTLADPDIDFAALAKSLGVWSSGPISDPRELEAALRRAVDVVSQGEPALVDVVAQPR